MNGFKIAKEASLVQEFARGLQLDVENVELQDEAKATRQLLSLEELQSVSHIFNTNL